MTQGAGQEPVVRTATLRDFRVPPYALVPVQGHAVEPPSAEQPRPEPAPAPADPTLLLGRRLAPVEDHGATAPVRDIGTTPPVQDTSVPAPVQDTSVPAPVQDTSSTAPVQDIGAPAPVPESGATAAATPAVSSIVSVATGHHPGNGFPQGEPPADYTPTERDLPVIQRGDTLQVPVTPDAAATPERASAPADGPGPLYVVGDVHGYLDELLAALRAQGLVDENGGWAAGNARLWFLGDFTDRGPDGIGVIDLVMRLSAEAAAAGGYCKALMGNHELLLIGAKRFADTPVNSGAGTATFQAAWLLNGGQKHDMDRLQDVHLQWMSRLDAVVLEDDHLLLHSDTTAYLEYGESIEDVNETVHEILTRSDADEVWDLFRKFTKRFAFRDDETGPPAVQELLSTYGGHRIVHGHSPIPYLLGQVGGEEDEGDGGPVVDGPHVYADGLAIAMDGGVTMAGKLLVVQLPLND
ncbi:metallophosphoesterase [Streptomyces sp. NPDC056144]|uniref:metallophosphoesterase n=1 Tax=unclassified Streptomyces TaxID=2593676 RepID=UPI0035D8B022